MSDNYDDTPLWKEKSVDFLFLTFGLLFLLCGVFVSSENLDSIARLLDVRQWNGFMITVAILNVIIIAYWLVVWRLQADETFDEDSLPYLQAFLLSSVVLCVESWIGFYLSTTEFPRYAGFQLRQLFCNGVYSNSGLALAFGITAAVIVNSVAIVRDVRTFLNNWA